MIVDFYKNIGESMTGLVERFRKSYSLDEKVKITYAGRLDPMAFGIVRILTHEDRFLREKMFSSDKIYQYKVIAGFQTDSFDYLGIVTNFSSYDPKIICSETTFFQPYPNFSSQKVKVGGKNMKAWEAYQKGIEFESKNKKITIHYNKLMKTDLIRGDDLLGIINRNIGFLQESHRFRVGDIVESWTSYIKEDEIYQLDTFEIKISSGGYVRTIANSFGGVAMDIERIEYIKN